MRVIVESLGRSTERPIQPNLDRSFLLPLWYQSPQSLCPISIRLDVQLDLSIKTYGDGERMPLEKAEFWDLKKTVLSRSVFPHSNVVSQNMFRVYESQVVNETRELTVPLGYLL